MARTRADLLLMARGLFDSRAKAQAAIAAGGVTADGRLVVKASETLDDDAELLATPAHPWVGRGALKLDHALTLWPIAVEGRVGLDVGASTGGFTEILLFRGASHVYAVDVGHDQLHSRIGSDPRVTDLSGLDARNLTPELIPQTPELVVSDVSFIALSKALPAALALAAPGADLVALIKPQFELGREHIGKGGLVKDPAARRQAIDAVLAFLNGAGWSVEAETESPILGGEGALEHLVWARKPSI